MHLRPDYMQGIPQPITQKIDVRERGQTRTATFSDVEETPTFLGCTAADCYRFTVRIRRRRRGKGSEVKPGQGMDSG